MTAEPGPIVYRHPKDVRRAWIFRMTVSIAALSCLVIIGVYAWFVLTFPLPQDALLEGLLLLGFLGLPIAIFLVFLLALAWHRRAPAVYTNGIEFPIAPARGWFRHAPRFVPFTDAAWVYGDVTNPIGGVKVGLRDGTVRGIPPSMLADRASFIDALRSFVSVVSEDPESLALVERLDATPEGYEKLWFVHGATRGREAAGAGIAALLTFVAIMLATGLSSAWAMVLGLAAVGLVAALAAHVVERFTKKHWMVAKLLLRGHVKTREAFAMLDKFFVSGASARMIAERPGKIVEGERTYDLSSFGGELRVHHASGSEYEPSYWIARLTYPPESESPAKEFRKAFARSALSTGWRSVATAKVGRGRGAPVRIRVSPPSNGDA